MNFEDQPIDEAFFAEFDKQSIKITPSPLAFADMVIKKQTAEIDTLQTRLEETRRLYENTLKRKYELQIRLAEVEKLLNQYRSQSKWMDQLAAKKKPEPFLDLDTDYLNG